MRPQLLVFLAAIVLSILAFWRLGRRHERESREVLDRAIRHGLDEPPSLHPVIDPRRCLGTAACVPACPEGGVLGVVEGRAVLIDPSRCIGHGACQAACPTGAIELVFGTARRGVEIPTVSARFESNVARIYIAGELGGMGLVRNATMQGVQAIEAIAASPRRAAAPNGALDVVIVGAGPAGLAATLAAQRAGLRYVTLEQEQVGGTIYHYPRRKMVVTHGFELPGYGRIRERTIEKEELLDLWREVMARTGVTIRVGERVTDVFRHPDGFTVVTEGSRFEAAHVLLAIGRRGSPRKLGVPGEECPRVAYAVAEPTDVRHETVLVVGGGNAAAEAAAALAAPELGNQVTLGYRGHAFGRVAEATRAALVEHESAGRLRLLLGSEVVAIEPGGVVIARAGERAREAFDRIYVMIGGTLPADFLRKIGVRTEIKHGTR